MTLDQPAPPSRSWMRRVALLVVAGSLGFIIAAYSLLLVLHGLGIDIAGKLDLRTGKRGEDAAGHVALNVVLLVLTVGFTAKVARRYRSSALVTNHPVATRLVVWPLAVTCCVTGIAAHERLIQRAVRDDAANQLTTAGLDEAQASCVANGLAASFPIDDDDVDLEMTSESIHTMLAIAMTCELDDAVDPCVIDELAAIAGQERRRPPIDFLMPFDLGAISRQDLEAAQIRC